MNADEQVEKGNGGNNSSDRLATESIPKLVLKFASTTLIALLLNTVYNLTDALFVSWGVGDHAMGGVSVVFPFVILQGAISTAVGGGAASLVSRKLGEGDRAAAGEITANAMLVFYVTAILTTLLGFLFMEPILSAMGVTAELYPFAKQYFTIVLLGNVFSTGFSSIIRAEGKMTYGLLIWVIPISINIALDALFILGFSWGVRGSALATVICQFASFCMSVLFFTRFSSQRFFGARFKWRRIFDILSTGLPSLVQMGSLSVITLLLNKVLSTSGGTLGVTAYGYMAKVLTYALVPFTAVAQALAPIVGFNFGTKNQARVNSAVSFGARLCFIYALAATALVYFAPRFLLSVFTADAEILSFGASGLRIISLSVLLTPLPMLIGATMQAEGKRLWALLLYAANLLFLPLPVWLLSARFGIEGVWWSYVFAGAASTLLAAVTAAILKRKPTY